MKYVDEYRNTDLASRLLTRIRAIASRRWTLMEVCGGQTHGLLRHGIVEELADVLTMLHGPGCPVCVTPAEAIDQAIEISSRKEVILASFGDMLRVPGSERSLLQAKSMGADVRIVYSPLDVIKIAKANPNRQVVFFAVGFETTAPATALTVLQAETLGLRNFSLLSVHVRVLPAMELIASAADHHIEGFLAAGHVCTITGFASYQPFVDRHRLPVVVTGFEPLDLLHGIGECIRMLEASEFGVTNAYARCAQEEGNAYAQRAINEVFEVTDQHFRGFGKVTGGGLTLRSRFEAYDALKHFELAYVAPPDREECRGGDIMMGRLQPPQCPHFGNRCTPEQPMGAPMVSSEGACAAYFAYQKFGGNVNIRSDW